MMNVISQSGVKILPEWNLIDCSLAESNDKKLMIRSITIEKEGETRTLSCDALLSFHEKTINFNTFLGSKARNYYQFSLRAETCVFN